MKLIFYIIFLAGFSYVTPGLLTNSFMRTKMQSLACNLARRYDDLKQLDVKFIKIAKDNTKHNDLEIKSSDYSDFLTRVENFKELGTQYLVYKMLYGDKLASQIYIDLKKNQNKNKEEEKVDEKDILERVKKIVKMTNGIGSENFATYQAVEYLQKFPFTLGKGTGCKVNLFSNYEVSLLERKITSYKSKYHRRFKKNKSKMKDPLVGWGSIKYYEQPKNAKVTDEPYWKKKNENFPMVVEYGKQHEDDCNFSDPSNIRYVDQIESVQLKKQCDIQIISDSTADTKETEIVPINLVNSRRSPNDQLNFNVKFYVSENRLDWNCIGWSVGLQDFLNTDLYTENTRKVTTRSELMLYLLQFSEAMKYVRNNTSVKPSVYNRILSKLKYPPPSLIEELINDDNPRNYLESHIIGVKNGVNQENIEKLCTGNFDGAIIFYGQDGKLTHGARYLKYFNLWTSKLGQSYLITHNLDSLSDSPSEKSLYGYPKFLYCPNGISQTIADGGDPNRQNFS
jgi:hypothetical protein